MMNMMPGTCPTSDGGGPGTPSSAMMEAVEVDRYCKVCGDKAVYVNYGALTCDSCKTFFRRQNLHPKVSLDCLHDFTHFRQIDPSVCRSHMPIVVLSVHNQRDTLM